MLRVLATFAQDAHSALHCLFPDPPLFGHKVDLSGILPSSRRRAMYYRRYHRQRPILRYRAHSRFPPACPFSCPAPWIRESIWVPLLTNKAPMPFGAYSLCPAIVSKSTFKRLTSTSILPQDCAASVWNKMLCFPAISPISSIGLNCSHLHCWHASQ